MSLESHLLAFINAVGPDIKALNQRQGTLSSLTTTAKTNLVAAINELNTAIGAVSAGAVGIDDLATDGNTTSTWSADKIFDTIEAAKQAVKNDLLDGAGAALNTLNELATALGNDPSFATTIASELGMRVRVDAVQSFTNEQKTQGRDNIGAASNAALTALTTAVGDTEQDLVAAYTAAKT